MTLFWKRALVAAGLSAVMLAMCVTNAYLAVVLWDFGWKAAGMCWCNLGLWAYFSTAFVPWLRAGEVLDWQAKSDALETQAYGSTSALEDMRLAATLWENDKRRRELKLFGYADLDDVGGRLAEAGETFRQQRAAAQGKPHLVAETEDPGYWWRQP